MSPRPDRPNILLVHSDQHRFDATSVNGHPVIQTPNMDRLAAEGTNFTHAFTPIPLCVPERHCLLTGQWPTEHGWIVNYTNEPPLPAHRPPTFVQPLRDRDYWLGYVAKWHVHPTLDGHDYGFHEFINDTEYGAWREAEGLPPRPGDNGWFGCVDPHITGDQSRMGWAVSHAIRMIETCAAGDRPFFIRWDPTEPHLPCRPPQEYADMYPVESVPPWPGFADSLEGKPYAHGQMQRNWKVDGWTWEQWAPVAARYYAEVSLLDAQLGRLLDTLDRLGLADDTLMIYTSDHGDMCGSHGMMDKHFIMYDDVVRVPMICRWPGRIAPGATCDAFVAHAVDLASTFCEAAGAPVPDTFRGQSLLPLFAGGGNDREDIFSTYHGNQFGLWSQRMVRDRRWKYVWNATNEDELYDLDADPAELHNRAVDPACADKLQRLRLRLIDWMKATHDRLMNGWIETQLREGLST